MVSYRNEILVVLSTPELDVSELIAAHYPHLRLSGRRDWSLLLDSAEVHVACLLMPRGVVPVAHASILERGSQSVIELDPLQGRPRQPAYDGRQDVDVDGLSGNARADEIGPESPSRSISSWLGIHTIAYVKLYIITP